MKSVRIIFFSRKKIVYDITIVQLDFENAENGLFSPGSCYYILCV